MKALILDGTTCDNSILKIAREYIEAMVKDAQWERTSFTLRDIKIDHCLGCFSCWHKTPGVCIIDDVGRNIAQHETESDFWIFLTPVTFGGYSSELKKAIDRTIPFILPYFMRVKGEIHHTPRYKKRPHLVVLGSIEKPDPISEEIFKTLVYRNFINFHCSSETCKILAEKEDKNKILETVKEIFSEFGT